MQITAWQSWLCRCLPLQGPLSLWGPLLSVFLSPPLFHVFLPVYLSLWVPHGAPLSRDTIFALSCLFNTPDPIWTWWELPFVLCLPCFGGGTPIGILGIAYLEAFGYFISHRSHLFQKSEKVIVWSLDTQPPTQCWCYSEDSPCAEGRPLFEAALCFPCLTVTL